MWVVVCGTCIISHCLTSNHIVPIALGALFVFFLFPLILLEPIRYSYFEENQNFTTLLSMEDSSAMETEPHAPEGEFPHSPWVDLGGPFTSPHNSPPMPEFSGFEYGPSPIMAVDGYGMSLPPPYTSMPLPMPSHAWPSMLTNHSPFHDGLPPIPAPISVSPSAPTPPVRKSSTGGATPRRTLTDEDRRQMCLYHEEHKTAKQTDIGGKITSTLI